MKKRFILYIILGSLFSVLQLLVAVMATQMEFNTDDIPFLIGQLIGLGSWAFLAYISFRAACRVKKKSERNKILSEFLIDS